MTRTDSTARTASLAAPLDTIVYDSPVLRIGKFRVGPDDPRFHDSGPAQNHIFVFPRTLVRIRHAGAEPFLAGPDTVTYYNRGQVYRRDSVAGRPDRCEWFAFREDVLRETLAARDPSAADRPQGPFRFSHGPSEASAYLAQRRVVSMLSQGAPADPLFVEETMLGVLQSVLRCRERSLGLEGDRESASCRGARVRAERDLAEAARVELGRAPGDRRSLSEVAQSLGVSVFHLCRVFRRHTGTTLHAYRTAMRLAAALELVSRERGDLTDVALQLGFSSHSHFTAAFRRAYGVTPSCWAGRRG